MLTDYLIVILVVFGFMRPLHCVEKNLHLSAYLDSDPFTRISGLSFEECKKECILRSRCDSVNYRRLGTRCELITASQGRTPRTEAGWVYSMKTSWNFIAFADCSECQDNQKCEMLNTQTSTCKIHECEFYNDSTDTLEVLGNMNAVGARLVAKCRNSAYVTPSAVSSMIMECGISGYWEKKTAYPTCEVGLRIGPIETENEADEMAGVHGGKGHEEEEGMEVYRGFSGKGALYGSWYNRLAATNDTSCLGVPRPKNCTRHYRHEILDQWESLNVSRVLFSIVKDNATVGNVMFDGRNSTVEDWFSRERILNSSWTDLNSTTANIDISIRGETRIVTLSDGSTCYARRRYVITKDLTDCANGSGWFLATLGDEDDPCCAYEKESTSFLYSQHDTAAIFSHDDIGLADYFSVFIFIENGTRVE